MATLKPCETCGKEIAVEARTCPHCGARNKRWAWVVNLLLISVSVVLVLFIVRAYNDRFHPFPACTSHRAAGELKSTFDGSPLARTLNLTAIDVVRQETISDDTSRQRRVCEAKLMLNNAQSVTYRFTFTPRPNGGYYIEGLPAGL